MAWCGWFGGDDENKENTVPDSGLSQPNARVENRTSQTILSSEGGSITIGNESDYSKGFELIIPPGALASDTTITIADVTVTAIVWL